MTVPVVRYSSTSKNDERAVAPRRGEPKSSPLVLKWYQARVSLTGRSLSTQRGAKGSWRFLPPRKRQALLVLTLGHEVAERMQQSVCQHRQEQNTPGGFTAVFAAGLHTIVHEGLASCDNIAAA